MILGGLSSIVIKDRQFIERLFSEIRIMEDNYFFDLIRREGEAIGVAKGREEGRKQGIKEGREEGRQEGREEGRVQGRKDEARRAILQVLKSRFGEASDDISSALDTIEDLRELEVLLGQAAVCENLETFLDRLS